MTIRMLLPRWSLKSRRNWIISSALQWTAPMTLLFCGVFYRDGSLTAASAMCVLLFTLLGGLGLAAVFCAYLTHRYGAFWELRDRLDPAAERNACG